MIDAVCCVSSPRALEGEGKWCRIILATAKMAYADEIDRSFFCAVSHLLLNGLDAIPSTLEALLPQADSIVTAADSQNVTAQTPADTPDDSIKLEFRALPARRARRIGVCLTRPDAHSSVLRG